MREGEEAVYQIALVGWDTELLNILLKHIASSPADCLCTEDRSNPKHLAME